MIGLHHYLLLGTVLFGIGTYGLLAKKNTVAVLMSVELMLNAVNVNFIAVNRYTEPTQSIGQMIALFVIVVAAAEVAVGLALIIAVFRQKRSVNLSDFSLLKW